MDEQSWEDGNRAGYATILHYCVRELGYKGISRENLIKEREQAVASLRLLCEEFGDNDWPANLHLRDIIDKHLGKYL